MAEKFKLPQRHKDKPDFKTAFWVFPRQIPAGFAKPITRQGSGLHKTQI